MKKNILLSILCSAILLGSYTNLESTRRKQNGSIENGNPNKKQKIYNTECPICLENLKKNSVYEEIPSNLFIDRDTGVITLNCGHSFHTKCILQWIYDYKKKKFYTHKKDDLVYLGRTCPSCRKEMPEFINRITHFDLFEEFSSEVDNNNFNKVQRIIDEAKNKMSHHQFKKFINLKDTDDQTVLILATIYDKLNIVQALLKLEADCNLKGIDGYTALTLAAANNNLGIIQALLLADADCNLKDIDGDTALINAVRNDNLEIVITLLNAGADRNLKNNKNESAIDIARKRNYLDIVEKLSR